jgi:bifunctional DNA-binding transcriptional regulator/antitoxin component of YhaV-PrlF toxin-antitoxin module
MKAVAQIEQDGRLTIEAEVLRAAGFVPGDSVELAPMGPGLLVAPQRSVDRVFANWAGFARDRPPMSLDEIVAEQRELRGHEDLD